MKKKSQPKEACYWSANIYLAEEIVKSTDYLIKHLKGYPGVFDKERCRRSRAKIILYSKANEKKWRNILTEIHDGFKLYRDCDGDFHEWKDGKAPPASETIEKMMERINSGNDTYKLVINKAKLQKFRNAMKLFAKYYEHLWD